MRSITLMLFLGGILSLGSAQMTDPEETEGEDEVVNLFTTPTTKMGAAVSDFGYNLFRQMAAGDSKSSVFLSPLSVSVALTQLSMGASEPAERQLYRALRYHTLQDSQLHQTLRSLISSVQTAGKGFRSAARVLLPRRLRVNPEYSSDVSKQYGVKPLTLMGGARDLKNINDWFKSETGGKVEQTFSTPLPRAGGVSAGAAAYFKGKWVTRFSQSGQMEEFQRDGEGPARIPMMQQRNYPIKMGVDSDLGCTIAQVQMDQGVSVYYFLPDEVTRNMTLIEDSLTAEFVQDLSMTLHPVEAELMLPILKLSYSFDALPLLSDLGLSDWLSQTDLTKITAQPAKLSTFRQKVVMETAPEGSQYPNAGAAAASQAMGVAYRVDRPFLFLVRDEPSGALLFIGKVLNPQDLEKA